MSPETLKLQLRYCQWVFEKNTSGVNQEESLRHPPSGGNCLNWLVGHLTASRQHMLTALGQEPLWSKEAIARFDRNSPPVTGREDAMPLTEMLEIHRICYEEITRGLDSVTPEQLAAKAPFSPSQDAKETVGSLLAGLVFHEAYHTGQTSYWRRAMGMEPSFR